jgi:glycosyltransferase involved in cell wall biosynthesis
MKIGLDVRMIQSSGIGTTIRGLIENLSTDQQSSLILYGLNNWKNPYPIRDIRTKNSVYSLTQHFQFADQLNKDSLDLYHMPHYDVPWGYKGKLVVTVHDLIHYLYPEFSNKPFSKIYSSVMLDHVSRKANRIIAVSEHTKSDIIRHFPQAENKVVVHHPGIHPNFKPVESNLQVMQLASLNLPKEYILYVGNIRKSKNTLGLIGAYLEIKNKRKDFPALVMVGQNSFKNKDLNSLHEDIRWLGEVDFSILPALYSAASLFVFPSLYEGFGIPPLESMACGTPALVSRNGSLPEICGEAACYIKILDKKGIADSIVGLYDNFPLRQELRAKGLEQVKKYSYRKFAEGIWNVYQEVINQSK